MAVFFLKGNEQSQRESNIKNSLGPRVGQKEGFILICAPFQWEFRFNIPPVAQYGASHSFTFWMSLHIKVHKERTSTMKRKIFARDFQEVWTQRASRFLGKPGVPNHRLHRGILRLPLHRPLLARDPANGGGREHGGSWEFRFGHAWHGFLWPKTR